MQTRPGLSNLLRQAFIGVNRVPSLRAEKVVRSRHLLFMLPEANVQSFFRTAALLLSTLTLVAWSAAQSMPAQGGQTPGTQPAPAQQAPDTTSPQGAQTSQPAAQPSATDSQEGLATPNSNVSQTPTSSSIADQLHLTPDQRQKLTAILDEENRQISAVTADQSLSGSDKVKRIHDIRSADVDKIKDFLTPEQQEKLISLQRHAGPPPTSGQTTPKKQEK